MLCRRVAPAKERTECRDLLEVAYRHTVCDVAVPIEVLARGGLRRSWFTSNKSRTESKVRLMPSVSSRGRSCFLWSRRLRTSANFLLLEALSSLSAAYRFSL
jgi:hypothetical protein